MSHDIFISYSTKDKKIAQRICDTIEDNGLKCWIAPRDISHGVSFPKQIVSGIKSATLILLIYSQNAQNSEYVNKEMYTAFSNRKHILPVLIDGTEPSGRMKFFLKIHQWLTAYPNPEDYFDTIVKDAKRLCEEIRNNEDDLYDEAEGLIGDYDEEADIKSYEELDFEREFNYGINPHEPESPPPIPWYIKYKYPLIALLVILVAVAGFVMLNGTGDNGTADTNSSQIQVDFIVKDDYSISGLDWKYLYSVIGSVPSNVSGSDYTVHTDFYDDSGKVIESNETKLDKIDDTTLATAGMDDDNVAKVTVELQDKSGKALYKGESSEIVNRTG
jgi:hypothetical protein